MWWPVFNVFVGGGLGAIAREFSMLMLGRYSTAFPVDVFVANVLASFLLGFIFGLSNAGRMSKNVTLLVSTGFCGGMSTFSTFIFGAYSEMTSPGQLGLSLLYIIASDVAPNFYPAVCSFWRLDLPSRACGAAGADAEPFMARSV